MATEPKKRAPARRAPAKPASNGPDDPPTKPEATDTGSSPALEARLKSVEAENSRLATGVAALTDRMTALEKQLRDRPTGDDSGEPPTWADKVWRQADYVGDQVRRNPLLSIALAIIVTALIFTLIG
ncbi:MAG: hypothetical protein HKM95_08515 [Inquilinus sp.]|nr:hypothetical protein [Inquilinus sp.]